MNLNLRPTNKEDLPFVIKTEDDAAKGDFVNSEGFSKHETYLANEDIRHLIIESDEKAVGYIILAGLKDKNENIEFRRIVVAKKGKGFGRKALRLAKEMAFEELKAHRFWLDVVDFNERAKNLYETEGFTKEGVWRECYKEKNGRSSLIFMSILRDEYRKN